MRAVRASAQREEPVSDESAPRGAEFSSRNDPLDLSRTQVRLPAQDPSSAKAKEDLADPLLELKNQMESLQKNLSDVETARTQLMEKTASVESELAQTKEASARREQEMAANIEAAKQQARTEGKSLGHAEGMESGYNAGLEKARAEVSEQYKKEFTGLAELLEGVSQKLDARFSELVALNEPRMLRLWQEMLEKMLQREIAVDPESVLDILSGVLTRLSDKNNVLIYVAPEDLNLLEESLQGEFGDTLRGVRHLEMKSDANVDKGSCIVETNLGVYDARWRTQFDQIDADIEKLFQKMGKPPKLKETPRRVRRGDAPPPKPIQAVPVQTAPVEAVPESESEQAQVQPEHIDLEQSQPERSTSERLEPERASKEPKPAAKKRASPKKKTKKSEEGSDG
jgi:flagellar assembly protein FliH